jgi:hypothetical protein
MFAAQGTPTAAEGPPPEICAEDDYENYAEVQEFPKGWGAWMVQPLASEKEGRILYLVTITLKPDECIPFKSEANQKDGGVVLIVHQGNIAYVAKEHPASPGAVVEHGALDSRNAGTSEVVSFGTEVQVKPDEWISQNAQVWFTYWNTSKTREAVIWKVVWAPPNQEDGCGGDCK